MDKEARNCSELTREPQFSQIIMPHMLKDGTIEIPKRFLKEHESRLPVLDVCLKISTGKMWRVNLKRCDGGVWLGDGWEEFVHNCSIQCGYTLRFKYDGGSFFHVFVFDTRNVEIEHPVSSATPNKQRVNMDQTKVAKIKPKDSDDDCSLEILDTWPQNKSNDRRCASDESIRRAMGFQSPNPHFSVIMRPSYRAILCIPKAGKRYFQGRADKSVCLKAPDGRSWFMKHFAYSNGIVHIRSGWREFVEEYHLQDEDRFVFELIDCMVLTFNVIIFQVNEEEVDKNDPVERARSMQCNNPSFSVVIKFNHQSLYYLFTLRVPADHALKYLSEHHEKQVFLKGVADKTWPVRCSVHGSVVRLSSGWKDFVLDNDLQDGDSCVFELLSQAPHHYNVTILRAAVSAKEK